jgi:hypothetical protein
MKENKPASVLSKNVRAYIMQWCTQYRAVAVKRPKTNRHKSRP